MRAIKGVPWWAAILGLLIMVDLGWRVWDKEHFGRSSLSKRFKVWTIHTNDADAITITDQQACEPVWTEWDFDRDGKRDEISYFFQGNPVFNVHLQEGKLPRYDVSFYGKGRSETWWVDRRGAGAFTERIFYNTNGVPSKHEVWYAQAWHVVDRRDEKNGIIINRQWSHLKSDTNGEWVIDSDK